MPKIEVTVSNPCEDEEDQGTKTPIGSVAEQSIADPLTLCRIVAKPDRKKSMIGQIEGNRFRNFKTFVESKILSKSDRSLEMEPIVPSPSGGSLAATTMSLSAGGQSLGNGKLNGAGPTVGGLDIVKKDNLQRRRSHLSMYEIEMTVRRIQSLFSFSPRPDL